MAKRISNVLKCNVIPVLLMSLFMAAVTFFVLLFCEFVIAVLYALTVWNIDGFFRIFREAEYIVFLIASLSVGFTITTYCAVSIRKEERENGRAGL